MELVRPDIGTIFWMLLMFIIVMVILKKFAWVPILTALATREKKIEDSIRSADLAKEEMEKMRADNELIMAQARKERDDMLKETKQASDQLMVAARDKAGEEAKKIVASAREQIKHEKTAAIAEIRGQVASLSVDIAEKILREKLKSSKEQQDLVEKLLDDIKLN
jgi:F-type H+-transporting ATPase subunit b